MTPRVLARSIAAGLLLTVAIATPIGAQEATPDPAAAAAEQARQQAEASAIGPRFVPADPGYAGCTGEPPESERVQATMPPGVDPAVIPNAAGWQVSAPRAPVHPGDRAALTLRDKAGTKNRMVYADVYRPDGTFARAGSTLFGESSAKLTYPADFRAGEALVPGGYTVVWRDTITDRFIACDGFVVAP